MSLRVRVRREINHGFETERRQVKEQTKEFRKAHREEFWNTQTQAENMWLQQYREERAAKQLNDMNRWRSAVCRVAMSTKKKLAGLEKRNSKLLETMRMEDLRQLRDSTDKRLMLDAMEIESTRNWPDLLNLESKINTDVVLPQTILNFAEYQEKLQRLAMYAEQGDHAAMQAVLDNQNSIDKKNVLLQPMFRELKAQIRHMSFSPEQEVIKEYLAAKKQMQDALHSEGLPEEKQAKQIAKLTGYFGQLLKLKRESLRGTPSLRLQTLQKRLEDTFELLNSWQAYIDVIYMPEAEANILLSLQSQGVDP